jgi:putative ABC transport system ATP-binding protein
MQDSIIETDNLSFQNFIQYKNIQIHKSRANFIVGKSGSGKSTLLRMFNQTLLPSGGTIYYNGKDISQWDTIELRKEVILISQSLFLFDGTIKDNFDTFYDYRELSHLPEDTIKEFLKLCCIDFPLDKDCLTMSGGEKQRIYIAIFLSFLPKVIMLDEPTSALDQTNSFGVIENILNFCKEKNITSIIVSHDSKITDAFADNLITLDS